MGSYKIKLMVFTKLKEKENYFKLIHEKLGDLLRKVKCEIINAKCKIYGDQFAVLLACLLRSLEDFTVNNSGNRPMIQTLKGFTFSPFSDYFRAVPG